MPSSKRFQSPLQSMLYKHYSSENSSPLFSYKTGSHENEPSRPLVSPDPSRGGATTAFFLAGFKRGLLGVGSDSEGEDFDLEHARGCVKRRRVEESTHSGENIYHATQASAERAAADGKVVARAPKDRYYHDVVANREFFDVGKYANGGDDLSDNEVTDAKEGTSTRGEHGTTVDGENVVVEKEDYEDHESYYASQPMAPGGDGQSIKSGVDGSVLEGDNLDGAESDEEEREVESTWTNTEMRRKYTTLCRRVRNTLRNAEHSMITAEELKDGLDNIGILETKYKTLLNPKSKKKTVRKAYPQTAKEVEELMRSDEEAKYPWGVLPTSTAPGQGMLFRTWDKSSQCQILDADLGLLSGGAVSDFKTDEGRKAHLEQHANWGNRKLTPFISTTPSVVDIQRTWIFGFRHRQKPPISTVRVTLINSRARLAAGWPIIKMIDQIDHYKVRVSCSRAIFMNEYLLPFRVRQEEIVWTWHWKDIQKWMAARDTENILDWNQAVAVPMFEEHERSRLAGEGADERELKLLELLQKVMPDGVRTNWAAAIRASLVG